MFGYGMFGEKLLEAVTNVSCLCLLYHRRSAPNQRTRLFTFLTHRVQGPQRGPWLSYNWSRNAKTTDINVKANLPTDV